MKPKDAVVRIENISFRDLRRQKLDMINIISKSLTKEGISTKEANSLEGILCLIDAIQDYAHDSGQLTHFQVFGKNYGIPGPRLE